MTVILMLAMFAIFLTIDYLRKGKEAKEIAAVREEAASATPRSLPTIISGFELPENRRYHQGHTWALQESPTLVRVGIDDFRCATGGKNRRDYPSQAWAVDSPRAEVRHPGPRWPKG